MAAGETDRLTLVPGSGRAGNMAGIETIRNNDIDSKARQAPGAVVLDFYQASCPCTGWISTAVWPARK